MRLISKFRDYYDFGMCYGIDPKLVYNRITSKATDEQQTLLDGIVLHRIVKYIRPSPATEGAVCFCGMMYPYVRWYGPNTMIWSYTELLEYQSASSYQWRDYREEDYFTPRPVDDSYFLKVGAPVFSIERIHAAVINPKLTPLKFHLVMDSTTCFNEISQYIGNILNAPQAMMKVSDKERIVKAGFDKRSFRH